MRMAAFQLKSQPSAACSPGFEATSGMPANSVPLGQMYLQYQGLPCPTTSSTVSGRIMTKPTSTT